MSWRDVVTGQHIARVKRERAIDLRRSMTDTETVLWEHLRKGNLRGFHFRRQQIIDGFIVDFYCHAAGVVVEIDGPVHADQGDYDAERDRILSARELKIMRFTNEEIENEMYWVIGEIGKACRLRQHHIS